MSPDDSALPTASVVIATRGRAPLLDRCLRVLQDQSVSPAAVIVVDNTGGDEAARAVAAANGARYIVEPRRGVSRARNVGAREAGTDVVVYLDDDAVPEPGWLAALVAEFRDPGVAAVAGRVLELSLSGAEPAARVIFGGPERLAYDRSRTDWFERASFGGVGSGANFAIRRAAFESWPGFDERLGAGTGMLGSEEHHALFSLIDRGYRVVYTPAAAVRHPYPATDAGVRRLFTRQAESTSALLALLLVEEKCYRGRAARYAFKALAGRPRTWRTDPPGQRLGARSAARARVTGVARYLRMRFETPARRGSA